MKPKSNLHEHSTTAAVEDVLNKLYLQAKAQFGNAIQSFWFFDGDLCPGCAQRSIGAIKFKGQDALSLNAFIFRERGVLIGYFLRETCVKYIFRAARINPYIQTPLHATIEKNLIAAYSASHPNDLI